MFRDFKPFLYILLFLIISTRSHAYDPCNVERSFNSQAKSICERVESQVSETNTEKFEISSVLLTKSLKTYKQKTNLILIPGGPGSDSQSIRVSFNQKDLINAFWAHLDVNVILYDPRGTGASQLSKTPEHYTYQDFKTSLQISDLKKVVEAFSPDAPVVLLAHSAGGNTAAKFAALYPDKVKGLILYSASLSNREVGLSNLRLFADEFNYFEKHIKSCGSTAAQLDLKRIEIEAFLKNILKVIRIQKMRPKELSSKFYLRDFRTDLIKSAENDADCTGRIPETLKKWEDRITALPKTVKNLVYEQKDVFFDFKTHTPPKISRSSWIKTALICSEGLLLKEFNSPLWLEGLSFSHDTCFGFPPSLEVNLSLDWTKDISSPTLLLGGSEDSSQLPSYVRRNAGLIKNSQTHIFDGGGHESHLSHSFEFYTSIENFLRDL